MESSLRSRKRKQRPSNSDQLDGIFTRSRSQIYVHKSRSGHTRPDCYRKREVINLEKRKSKSVVKLEESEGVEVQITGQSSVKDLRARRVFSPATISDNDDDDVSTGDDVDLKGKSEIVVDLGVLDSVTMTEDDVDDCKKTDGNSNALLSDDILDSVDLSIFDSVRENNDCKKIDGSNLSVSDSVNDDFKAKSEIIVDLSVSDSVRENDVVQMTPTLTGLISVVNETLDTKGSMSKSQSSVTSLRGRKKVFKSPSSFSYRRMLPYLSVLNDDSSNFEIVEAKLPEKVQKLNYKTSNMIGAVSDCSKLADYTFDKAKSLNVDVITTVEGSNVVQKSNDDVIDDTLDDCVQTPPDSDIYSQSKVDKALGVTMKPTSKQVLNSWSRMKLLQTPTSFSHRRLLPILMSVSEDSSCVLKSNSLKLEKVTEQNQYQNVSMDESKTDSKSVKPSSTDEKSDSPTSTLVPVDTSFDIMKTVSLVSSVNNLGAGGPDTGISGSNSPLEVNLEAVNSDSSIKLEQSSPKNDLKSVEETASKAIVTCTEQNADTNDGKEIPHQSVLPITPVNSLGISGKNIKSGILKRTPRGCRGICNCLNCTSFRLHAERSFEFSRNQMHDAEDVALELINDLSSLRTILEKTASDCNSLDTDKEKQIKETCEKALYKEEVARARLAQMNEDLSIHCRSMKLLRPNVTFANKTEEKIISRDHVFENKSI